MSEETRKTIRYLPEMVEKINRRLDKEKLTPPTPEKHKKSNTLRRQEFLKLAIENFGWDENTVANTWPDDEEITPPELTGDDSIEERMYREYHERRDAHHARYKPAINAYLEFYRGRQLPSIGKIIGNVDYDWELVFDEIAKAIRKGQS